MEKDTESQESIFENRSRELQRGFVNPPSLIPRYVSSGRGSSARPNFDSGCDVVIFKYRYLASPRPVGQCTVASAIPMIIVLRESTGGINIGENFITGKVIIVYAGRFFYYMLEEQGEE